MEPVEYYIKQRHSIIMVTLTKPYKARHAHKCLCTVLPIYSKIQALPGITSCRLMKNNKPAIELNDLLRNTYAKDVMVIK